MATSCDIRISSYNHHPGNAVFREMVIERRTSRRILLLVQLATITNTPLLASSLIATLGYSRHSHRFARFGKW